jgi:hypothetical protein
MRTANVLGRGVLEDTVDHAGTLPFAVVERFVAAAKRRLPPTKES